MEARTYKEKVRNNLRIIQETLDEYRTDPNCSAEIVSRLEEIISEIVKNSNIMLDQIPDDAEVGS